MPATGLKCYWLVELHGHDLATRAHAAVAVDDDRRAVRVFHDRNAPSAAKTGPGAVRVDVSTRTEGNPAFGLLPVAVTLPPSTTPTEAVDLLAANVGALYP